MITEHGILVSTKIKFLEYEGSSSVYTLGASRMSLKSRWPPLAEHVMTKSAEPLKYFFQLMYVHFL